MVAKSHVPGTNALKGPLRFIPRYYQSHQSVLGATAMIELAKLPSPMVSTLLAVRGDVWFVSRIG